MHGSKGLGRADKSPCMFKCGFITTECYQLEVCVAIPNSRHLTTQPCQFKDTVHVTVKSKHVTNNYV